MKFLHLQRKIWPRFSVFRRRGDTMLKRDRSWWSARWLEQVVDVHSNISYTIEGISVSPGCLHSKVTKAGERRPHEVVLKCTMWSSEEWKDALELLSSQAAYTASLINGTLPEEVERQ